jgi:hypothetical protein
VPEFDLKEIKKAAKAQGVQYAGRGVFRDTHNLGYQMDDVIDCICSLSENDFRKTMTYQNALCDDYVTSYTLSGNSISDDLYVKLRLIGNPSTVEVMSFHQPR